MDMDMGGLFEGGEFGGENCSPSYPPEQKAEEPKPLPSKIDISDLISCQSALGFWKELELIEKLFSR
jgi:hypothetical protein